ncbi:hypothetical protein [Streptomyces sp. WMMC500]|uniref:hypothetical protein n=1 Tax=Streptomyces sp. WMMC500 TaxID=3015154 RepID=UPI0032B1E9A0
MKSGASRARGRAAWSGSLMAGSREVYSAAVFSAVTGSPATARRVSSPAMLAPS